MACMQDPPAMWPIDRENWTRHGIDDYDGVVATMAKAMAEHFDIQYVVINKIFFKKIW